MDKSNLLTSQSPAALAEEYIVKSIWNKHFVAGSDLPSEREMARIIGITRTTLREVLHRLARDGWLSIQHGKATKVNDIWETGGPNIISTLIRLDKASQPMIIANVVSLRTRMAEYYIPEAVRFDSKACEKLFADLGSLEDSAIAFAEFDYQLYRRFTFVAEKPIYGLILNSFKALYHQVATLFFSDAEARQVTRQFYHKLLSVCANKDPQLAHQYMVENRQHTTKIWGEMLKNLPDRF